MERQHQTCKEWITASRSLRDEFPKNTPSRPRLVCILRCPEGVAEVERQHPGTVIHTAAHDRALNAKKYIIPGLGDFGDRLDGT